MSEMPESYADIVKKLGHLIPCYAHEGAGCPLEDDVNERECADDCLMLRIYRAGFDAALKP